MTVSVGESSTAVSITACQGGLSGFCRECPAERGVVGVRREVKVHLNFSGCVTVGIVGTEALFHVLYELP